MVRQRAATPQQQPQSERELVHHAPVAESNSAAISSLQPGMAKIRATREDPLDLPPGMVPAEHAILHRLSWSSLVAGFEPVDRWRGSVDAPSTSMRYGSELFIDSQPRPDDVHQGYINDCYYLAGLIGLAQGRPAHIEDHIEGDATGATVTLYRKDDDGSRRATPVHVDGDLAHTTSGTLLGARVRHAERPSGTRWWADLEEGELDVHAEHDVEAAWWVPLFEKALVAFTERYGDYGEGGADQGGYDEIEYGHTHRAMSVLTGAEDGQQLEVDGPSPAVLRALLRLGDGAPGGGDSVVTAAITHKQLAARLEATTDAVISAILSAKMAKWSSEEMEAAGAALSLAQDLIQQARVIAAGDDDTPLGVLTEAPARLAAIDLHEKLLTAAPALRSMRLQIDLAGRGMDDPEGDVLAQHEYAVLGAALVDRKGQPIDASIQDEALAKAVHLGRSTVKLRDPLRKAEPRSGGQAEDGALDGAFTVSLRRFLDTFGQVSATALPG